MIYQPSVVYHETAAYCGGDLLPLARRMNRAAALVEFLRRWPLCARAQAQVDIGLVWTTDSPYGGRGQGNVVLAINAALVPDLEWFMHEDEVDGGWVAESIPASAIIGIIGEPDVAAEIARIEALEP